MTPMFCFSAKGRKLTGGFLIGDADRGLQGIELSALVDVKGGLAVAAIADEARIASLASTLQGLDNGSRAKFNFRAAVDLDQI